MKTDAVVSHRTRNVGRIVVALIGMIATPPSAFSAERVVLGEYFTWLDCIYCPAAGQWINLLVNRYGVNGSVENMRGRLAIIEYNIWDQYELIWGDQRRAFYGVNATPSFIYDGYSNIYPDGVLETFFLARAAVPTPVTMQIAAEEASPSHYDVDVEVCLEADADPVLLKIYTIMVEDYYPPIYWYHRNGLRVAAPLSLLSLTPGECQVVSNQLVAGPHGPLTNMKVVTWAQEPAANYPADVYQAAISAYPFVPPGPPCPWDCGNDDGDVGINDFLLMLADWGGPSACDFDGDGVSITDFLILLGNWGPCPE